MPVINPEEMKAQWVKEFNLGAMSPEKQEEMISKMIEALLKRIYVGTMEKLGEAGMVEYDQVVESAAGEEALQQFLEGKIPGYDAFVKGIAEEFNQEMKQVFGAAA